MGGIGLTSTDTTSTHTPIHTIVHTPTYTPANNIMHRTQQYRYMHTERTQFAHTQTQIYTIQKQQYNNMNIQDNKEHNTEQTTQAAHTNCTQPQQREQHTCSAHNYRTYSFDFMFNRMYQKTL